MMHLVYCLKNISIFDIPLLRDYINLISLITFCIASVNIYLTLYISLPFLTAFKLFCGDVSDTLIILSAVLLLTEPPVAPSLFGYLLLMQI